MPIPWVCYVAASCPFQSEPCECLPGFTGARCDRCEEGLAGDLCDRCAHNTTGLFPSCERCNQCSGDWWLEIEPLKAEVNTTINLLLLLNNTNATLDLRNIPELNDLFDLIAQIDLLLGASEVEVLASNISRVHSLLCELSNRTRQLLSRAEEVESRITALEARATQVNGSLVLLESSLSNLTLQLRDIQRRLDQLAPADPQPHLQLAAEAQERAQRASTIVETEVKVHLQNTSNVLSEFHAKFNESGFAEQQAAQALQLEALNRNLAAYHDLIVMATVRLCGGDGSCGQCGGVECEACGGEGCAGLVADSTSALNTSSEALRLAREGLERLQLQVGELVSLANQSSTQLLNARAAQELANQTALKAVQLSAELTDLVSSVAGELNISRIDPDTIRQLDNMTLSFSHNISLEQVTTLVWVWCR